MPDEIPDDDTDLEAMSVKELQLERTKAQRITARAAVEQRKDIGLIKIFTLATMVSTGTSSAVGLAKGAAGLNPQILQLQVGQFLLEILHLLR